MSTTLTRRTFLHTAGAAAGVGIGAAYIRSAGAAPAQATLAAPMPQMDNHEEMDALHEEGIQIFLENIGKDKRFWHNPLDYTLDDGVKVFELTCTEMEWEVSEGHSVNAMAFNGSVPGPEIRVTEGDDVRIIVHNKMSESTGVHWHGLKVPNNMDGVPFLTQPPIKPGESFTYSFQVKNAGSHMYHSHHNAMVQVTRGLLGPFIVERKEPLIDPPYDSDYTLILNDAGIGMTINGKSFPYTQPIVAKLGERVRIRYMNEGLQIHPMHLHGLEQMVIAKDGWRVPLDYKCDTVNVAPGERWDVIVECHTPGAWAFHCHILSHAESPHGMFGMVTALVVEE